MDLAFLGFEMNSGYMALFYTMGLGGALASASYFIYSFVMNDLRMRLISQITINSDDPLFEWMLEYLKD
jgi:hypothetical protein